MCKFLFAQILSGKKYKKANIGAASLWEGGLVAGVREICFVHHLKFFFYHMHLMLLKKKLCQIIEGCHLLPSRPHWAAMWTQCACGLQSPVPRLTNKEIPPNNDAERVLGFS